MTNQLIEAIVTVIDIVLGGDTPNPWAKCWDNVIPFLEECLEQDGVLVEFMDTHRGMLWEEQQLRLR